MSSENAYRKLQLDSTTLAYASSFMRAVICYNQGEYAQYNFLAGELHKMLKDSLREFPTDIASLRGLCDQLEEFLRRNLTRVAHKNFAFIKQYFHGRHSVEPRLCVKGNYEKDGKPHIVNVIRDRKVTYWSEYALEDNSGFLEVSSRGLHFICNNIPEGIITGKYRNARIDPELVREYKERSLELATPGKQGFQYDEAWMKCWNTPDPPEPQSCYKSTIIIPMTLRNNKLDRIFWDIMSIKARKEVSRTVFGYLCLDHIQENYFNDIDIDVGYIFADILSLYMITRSVYTEISDAFYKAAGSFSKQELVEHHDE